MKKIIKIKEKRECPQSNIFKGRWYGRTTAYLKETELGVEFSDIYVNYPQFINKVQKSLLNLPNIKNLVKIRTKLSTQLSNITH